jgi:hypothetical protein
MREGRSVFWPGSAVSMTTSAKSCRPLSAAIALPSWPDFAVTVFVPTCLYPCSMRCRMVRWWLIMSTEGCWGMFPSFRMLPDGGLRQAAGYETASCVRACDPTPMS